MELNSQRMVFYNTLKNSFNLVELHELCFRLDLDSDIFPSKKDAFIIELINYMIRENRTDELAKVIARLRPGLTSLNINPNSEKHAMQPAQLRSLKFLDSRNNISAIKK